MSALSLRPLYSKWAIIFVCLISGCASIIGNKKQSVSISASLDGQAISEVSCVLKNDRGEWRMTAPGFVEVQRSAENLNVLCSKAGMKDGMLTAISQIGGPMLGNLLTFGVIGAAIDHSNGKAYNYPDPLIVKMGQVDTIDRKNQILQ